jgi:hypothetical protein
MGTLSEARHAVAAVLEAGFAALPTFTVYPSPPPQPVPPCAMILPGNDYLPPAVAYSGHQGPTACAYTVAVIVRLVTDVHEPSGAFDALDDLVETALATLGRWGRVDTGLSRDIAGTSWLTADIHVTYTAERAALIRSA